MTEEVWSWWRDGSVHRATWPTADDVRVLAGDGDPLLLADIGTVLSGVRKAKSEAKVSMRTEVAAVVVRGPADALARVEAGGGDLSAAGRIGSLSVVADGAIVEVDVTM